MEIKYLSSYGHCEALHGLGLSYGITSQYDDWTDFPKETQAKLRDIASKLAGNGCGEDKFLRMMQYWWSVKAPRYLWQEIDQYRIGVTTQSESTMHTIMHKELEQSDFETEISYQYLYHLNLIIKKYQETKGDDRSFWFNKLKNDLPEGFLQRRIWSLSLAQMLNIYRQRKNHRLPQWRTVCEAFVEATPDWLRTMYGGQHDLQR